MSPTHFCGPTLVPHLFSNSPHQTVAPPTSAVPQEFTLPTCTQLRLVAVTAKEHKGACDADGKERNVQDLVQWTPL